ncbi:hypothetical protein [Roseateles chitinivorans]|uniref:hypothetical protein n=1 Tax=Roseateles chitinivorans TaxID=2917965 RepID=UPI003D6708C7
MDDDPLAGVRADLTATSNQISSQVRTIVLGVLAFVWLFLSGAKDIPAEIVCAMPKSQLIVVAILCILSLLADWIQYFLGYRCSLKVLKEFDPARPVSAEYDTSTLIYRARGWSFWAKQAFAAAAVAWMLILLARGFTA